MSALGTFPFGQPVKRVTQVDRTPKRVFVLGVYASAVHAQWIGPNGKTLARALAVASEPEIFWRGDNAQAIVETIEVPEAAGHVIAAAATFNGPSGKALDDCILEPLGLTRSAAWLCDLVPHSCRNPGQEKAIERVYAPAALVHKLAAATVPTLPSILADETRRNEILAELEASQASTLILLGDEPIKWFLSHFGTPHKRLIGFGQTPETYGRLHPIPIAGRDIDVLPLVHPRQAARLGSHSPVWHQAHTYWMEVVARSLNMRG
jgi:uracil-DNA glycosylase